MKDRDLLELAYDERYCELPSDSSALNCRANSCNCECVECERRFWGVLHSTSQYGIAIQCTLHNVSRGFVPCSHLQQFNANGITERSPHCKFPWSTLTITNLHRSQSNTQPFQHDLQSQNHKCIRIHSASNNRTEWHIQKHRQPLQIASTFR